MSSLGIYFGPKIISVTETKGKVIVNNTQISRQALSAGGLEEKVSEELKLVALLKEELRKNKIEATEVSIALSGKDLIIRNFDIPILPKEEVVSAINFEAKKYIPFKAEELVSDFQSEPDKINHRDVILYAAIKKEILDKYLSILSQANIKLTLLEYSAFSILKFLKLTGTNDKGIIGFISVDLKEEDEVNFTVIENGFPLFSRDIDITAAIAAKQESLKAPENIPIDILEKLKTEIRISLDYYHRKFPTKRVEKMYFVADENNRSELIAYTKELGLMAQFVDINKYIGKPMAFSLGFAKSYACSLSKITKTKLKIDLLAARTKTRASLQPVGALNVSDLLKNVKVEPGPIILGCLICAAVFLFGLYRIKPIQQELNAIISSRPQIKGVSADSSYEQLNEAAAKFKNKINTVTKLATQQVFLTRLLNVVPEIIPEGMWLLDFSFKKEDKKTELRLRGNVYLGNPDKEMEAINSFTAKLKQDPVFSQYFKEFNVLSINQAKMQKADITSFVISCQDSKERGR